ncbi:RNA polymerase sigma-70 factor (ECF subfamily) [Nocardioides thalensis]|uniref:RNA polymerase sigma-70 factor (ECF subfamily) n=1 Tax=Nocardioides thalensis TaxID=1914755 RepID=A0A853CAY0_9ACTN|nr:RNA polymerase sigma-70 factor (ECF subfamily) [Nocardioides thalensis]
MATERTVRTDERTDAELLAAHVAGDAEAFGELFARHRDRLWAVALRTMGEPEGAADGLQDGMIAAFRRAGSYRGDAAVTSWLHRVVVNACLDRLRAAKVRRADPLPDDVDETGRGSLDTAASGTDETLDPAEHSARADQRRQVLAALGELSADQRAAIVLVDMEGYSVAEAAAILDCAEGTVKSRCSRGRARLAELLRPLLDDTDTSADAAAVTPVTGNPPSGPDVGPTSPPRGPPDEDRAPSRL